MFSPIRRAWLASLRVVVGWVWRVFSPIRRAWLASLRVVVGWVWRVFSPIRRAWLASFGWWVGADGWHQAPAEAPALTVELALCDHVTSITYRP